MTAEIDTIIAEQIRDDGPGAAVAVVKNGQVIHRQGYGLANLEWQIPIQPDTVFRLASISKQFTAMAIMILQEQGKLDLADSLTKFLPDYPTSGHDIRLHHLLTHTSGIKSYTDIEGWFPHEIIKDMTPEAVCAIFSRIPFDFKPGTRFRYNNSAYHLLGMIIEKVAQTDYAGFMQAHIFQPLGMENACYMNNEPIIPRRASGYDAAEDQFRNAPYLSMTQPYSAGALGATIDDLVCWDNALRQHRLVAKETLEQMWRPVVLEDGTTEAYGFGWGIEDYQGRRMVHHSGGINGFSTLMAHLPDDGIGVYILSNLSSFDTTDAMLGILPQALEIPRQTREPVTLRNEQLARLAGVYQVPGGWSEEILYEAGELKLKGQQRQPHLLAQDETHFYLAGQVETEMTFALDAAGQATSLTIRSPFGKFSGNRIQDEATPE